MVFVKPLPAIEVNQFGGLTNKGRWFLAMIGPFYFASD